MSDLQNAEVEQSTEAPADAALQQEAEPSTQATEAGEVEKETPVERTFTQKELEAATAKAAAKAERRATREALDRFERMQQPREQQKQADERPQRRNGEADDVYLDRLTDWKLDQRDQHSRQQQDRAHAETLTKKTNDIYAQAEKEPGFDRDDFDEVARKYFSPVMASAVTESDVAPKVMAYMAQNPQEVERIAKLSPARQAAEIGKLEDKLTVARTSRAPAPIKPVGTRGNAVPDIEKMTFSQYEAWRRTEGGR